MNQQLNIEFITPQFIILDLDNTISDDLWRYRSINWEAEHPKRRYGLYHRLAGSDVAGNKHLFEGQDKGIIISTARPDEHREKTEDWLRMNGVKPVLIVMRQEHQEGIRSSELKKIHLETALKHLNITKQNIHCAYDDREDVVMMYREQGINAYVAAINHHLLYEQHGAL